MNIIGISGFDNSVRFKKAEWPGLSRRQYRIAQGFDAAATLVRDGQVVAAAAEERFTYEKATGAFPINAIRYCLKEAGLGLADVDYIAHGFSYDRFRSYFEQDPYTARQFDAIYSRDALRRVVGEHLPDFAFDDRFVQVPHHLAHAASTHYLSGFDESLTCVVDGMGEMESMTLYLGRGNELEELVKIPALHSLGILYGIFTMYLGFHMNHDEYKVMGLAPYGNAREHFAQVMELIQLKPDGTYSIGALARDATQEEKETHDGVINYLAEKFGPAREPGSEMSQRYMDLAASLQAALQTCLMHTLTHFARQTRQRNLAMAGGVALNCTANGVIRRSGLFRKMFIQPAAGDDGSSTGAALHLHRHHHPQSSNERMPVPYWGPGFSNEDIAEELDGRDDIEVTRFDSFAALSKEVAGRLRDGQIISWFQGRMEFGPRALGNRSILGDPRAPDMRDRINALIKKREGFRPFAPAVMASAASRFFEIDEGDEETYEHMLYVVSVKPEHRDGLPAITHVDGSARIQTVTQESNERFFSLLTDFGALTDVPIILNTSFNVQGQPIVCTPREGVDTCLSAGLDALAIGDFLVLPKGRA